MGKEESGGEGEWNGRVLVSGGGRVGERVGHTVLMFVNRAQRRASGRMSFCCLLSRIQLLIFLAYFVKS